MVVGIDTARRESGRQVLLCGALERENNGENMLHWQLQWAESQTCAEQVRLTSQKRPDTEEKKHSRSRGTGGDWFTTLITKGSYSPTEEILNT